MAAIQSEHQATIVVAGAGSGKTLTIMGKIKYLLEYKNYCADEILCISFTNETVRSLKEKLKQNEYAIEVLTFHKLGLKILGSDFDSIVEADYLEFIIAEYFETLILCDKKKKKKLHKLLKHKKSSLIANDFYHLKKIIATFIKLAKSNYFKLPDVFNFYRKSFGSEKQILKYILDIYLLYERELESTKKVDFDDMISRAIEKVKFAHLKYKYIIIDEFQDTSLVRYNLIKEIINYTNAKLFVVGDDWQSIYRFSGCNLELFIHFNQYFKDCAYYYLKYTYRNSMELIQVSSKFIMRNKQQLKKQIISSKSFAKPIKIVFNYSTEELIQFINNDDILIIGRNNIDIQNIKHKNKLTIHRSKGLEASKVILVNSDSIPSKIKSERILRYVLKDKEYVLFEEERRLFYVALTRTKEDIYIMVNKNVSPFVHELLKNHKQYIEIIKK